MISDLVFTDLTANQSSNIKELVTRLDVSWTMDAVSQISFEVVDIEFKMMKANYFQVRRELTYEGSTFEIASVELDQGRGQDPSVKIEARTAAVQKMKRDKEPQSYSGASPTEYARMVASKFGLGFVGQPTAASKVIIQASTDAKRESVWDVLSRLAGESQYVLFEASNILYFASQEWLMWKWGNHLIHYRPSFETPFSFIEIPRCRRSDDDVFGADFSGILEPTNAVGLRPGMTVTVSGVHGFEGGYLLTEVSYEDGTGLPVSIAGRTPEKVEAK